MGIALFPGSFDPLTYGHLDVIQRATKVFEKVEVAVAVNASKAPIFTVEERLSLIGTLVADLADVTVSSFEGITVEYMRKRGIHALVRGIRTFSDFEYEAALANANRRLAPDIETVFIMSGTEYSFISSRMIREIAMLQGNLEAFVPPLVAKALRARAAQLNGK
ncbi:MAG: pantetheine-phosphate adenylyltransferase [Planctomycetota bacterium]